MILVERNQLILEHLSELRRLSDAYGLPIDMLIGRIGLRPREVARSLGVAYSTVEGWIEAGKLPASKIDRVVVIPIVELLRFLEEHRVKPRQRAQPQGSVRTRARAFIEDSA